MKVCPNCNANVDDAATFCPSCGTALGANPNPNPNPQPNPGFIPNQGAPMYNYAPIDPYDHTAEFNPKDISDNKVIAMLVYLLGTVGIIIALLGSNQSAYVGFHVRQALKFTVVSTLVGIVSLVLVWTVIVPIAAGIFVVVLMVIKIICFFQICQGKAVEPYIIRNLGFLK